MSIGMSMDTLPSRCGCRRSSLFYLPLRGAAVYNEANNKYVKPRYLLIKCEMIPRDLDVWSS